MIKLNLLGATLMWSCVLLNGYLGYTAEYWYLIPLVTVVWLVGYFLFRLDWLLQLPRQALTFLDLCRFYLSGLLTCSIAGIIGYGFNIFLK